MRMFMSLTLVLAATAAASAEPSVTATATEAPQAPALYVQAGVMLGGDAGIYWGESLEAGYRFGSRPLWIHGEVETGSEHPIWSTGDGRMAGARLGVEARVRPGRGDFLRLVAGVDAGARSIQVKSENRADMSLNGVNAMLLPRVGLDLGGYNVRFRPGIEVGFDIHGAQSLAFTAALAYEH